MRVIEKILRVIIVGILSVLLFVLDQVAKVYSLVAGTFFTLFGICLLLAILCKQWNGVIILSMMVAMVVFVFFMLGIMMLLMESAKIRFLK